MKLLRSGFVIFMIALLFVFASPATAQQNQSVTVSFYVNNQTDACAWITTYWSYKSEAHWRIHGGNGRPQWLAPNGRLTGQIIFNFKGLTPQLRFLAEVRPSAQCSGSGGTRIMSGTRDIPLGSGHIVSASLTGSRATGYRFNI